MLIFRYDPNLVSLVRQAFIDELRKRISVVVLKLKNNLTETIKRQFYRSVEYHSLIDGELLAEMGLPEGSAQYIIDAIVNTFADEVEVLFNNDRLTINIGLASFERILSLSVSQHQIPWLEWLLLEGDKVLVDDAGILYGDFHGYSRSGRAIMVTFKSKSNVWRVPAQYSGTAEDNFITRALSTIVPHIITTIQQTIVDGL